MTIEFSFFFSLKYKKSFVAKQLFQLNCLTFPHCGPLLKSLKAILTQLNIYLFANNPEILFSALLSFFSLTRTPFSDLIFILAAILEFRAAILKIGVILIG